MTQEQKEQKEQKQEKFRCKICDRYYEMSEARKREMACCGQPLTSTEKVTKSTPTPFGP